MIYIYMHVIYVTCMSYPYFLKPSNHNDAPCVCTDAAHFISEFFIFTFENKL